MWITIIVIAVVAYFIYIDYKRLKGNPTRSNQNPSSFPDNANGAPDGIYRLGIRGINARKFNGKLRSGLFEGYIKSDPDNEYDSNAIAIYRSDDLLLGYVAKWKTDELRGIIGEDWTDRGYPIFGEAFYEDRRWHGDAYIVKFESESEMRNDWDELMELYRSNHSKYREIDYL